MYIKLTSLHVNFNDDDIVELKNREEALIAAEARFTELNGRIEVGLVKMDRMLALMEQ